MWDPSHRQVDQVRQGQFGSSTIEVPGQQLPSVALGDRLPAGALRQNLTVYHAAYVALAELLDLVLLTADARLSKAPGLRCEVEVLR